MWVESGPWIGTKTLRWGVGEQPSDSQLWGSKWELSGRQGRPRCHSIGCFVEAPRDSRPLQVPTGQSGVREGPLQGTVHGHAAQAPSGGTETHHPEVVPTHAGSPGARRGPCEEGKRCAGSPCLPFLRVRDGGERDGGLGQLDNEATRVRAPQDGSSSRHPAAVDFPCAAVESEVVLVGQGRLPNVGCRGDDEFRGWGQGSQ